jgi:hypothetical protein
MAGPIPYDLTSLNGISFTDNEVSNSLAPPADASTGSIAPSQAGPNVTFGAEAGGYSATETFTVTDAVNHYVAGFTANGYYYMPTFGTLTLAINDGVHAPKYETLYVHGFEDNGQGVFATNHQNLTMTYGYGHQYFQTAQFGNPAYAASAHWVIENAPLTSTPETQHFGNDGSSFHADPTVVAPPPAQSAIPYSLNGLNGVVLGDGHVSIGLLGGFADGTLDGFEVDAGASDPAAGVESVNLIASTGESAYLPPGDGGGSVGISNVHQFYIAGHVGANGEYYLPTFGSMTLKNHGGNQGAQTFYIHGFADNGRALLFSKHATLFFGAGTTALDGNQVEYAYSTENNLAHEYVGIISTDDLTGPGAPSFPLTFTSDGSNFVAPCYAEGSRILTARGEVAVEDLIVGDEAVLASGGTRPVIWIGSRRVRCDNHPRPHEVNPVRIKAGAFGDGLPVRDLVVSPGHALYVDGVLIPAHSLVNGATIVQEQVDKVRYFHIELDAHDVILAEGLPCESYLDDGNRETFGNAMEYTALHGRLDPISWDQACAPMVAAGPQLTSVQARLHERALAMGWTRSEEPNLCLLADGVAVVPVMAKANRYWFAVPACSDLVLSSNASILAQVMPGLPDTRQLGVAVSDLKLDGEPLDLAQAFTQGAHDLETHEAQAWRWTNGAAHLALTLAEPAMVEITVMMTAPTWQRQVPALRLVQAG